MTPTILWFRQDLRLQDNPALHAALGRGGAVIPVFIWDPAGEWGWPLGPAARGWLRRSLASLDAALREHGSRLLLARGDTEKILRDLGRESGAGAVYWNRRYELAAVARDSWIETDLESRGIEVRTFNAALLHEPHAIANRQGRPFQIFSPYWRTCLSEPVRVPWRLPAGDLPTPAKWPASLQLDELDLEVSDNDDARYRDCCWQPGEKNAAARLREFVVSGLAEYEERRDRLAHDGTSRLSPHLHFGEVSPRQIWAAVRAASRPSGVFPPNRGAVVFLQELGWREFGHHLLFNFPHTQEIPLREEFSRFRWAPDPGGRRLRAWQRGRTGYPIVDAAMRQLETTGWMHNRARMIAASFLVKHLRISWREGARWFWETLVDADLANNTLGWQWSAGCGADAAPYFRIFAPVLQAEKFDPEGEYVRRWVPELAQLPPRFMHAPWEAPASVLTAAGVTLGENYPRPIVDHRVAREEAMAAFQEMRRAARP